MAILIIVSALAGAVLAMRYKVLILVPATGIGFALVLAVAMGQHDSLAKVALALVAITTCLQVGYLVGIGLRMCLICLRFGADHPTEVEAAPPYRQAGAFTSENQ